MTPGEPGPRVPPGFRRSFVEEQYPAWVRNNRLRPSDLRRMRHEAEAFAYKPLVSVVLPVYNPDEGWLEGALDSVMGQVYPNWELCIRDDASTREHVRQTLSRYEKLDLRIKVSHGRENLGICGASNAALSMATGEFVALLDHDDELAPDALFEVVRLLQERPGADLIYTDEDMMDAAGNRFGPRFKPDWSPEMLLALNYVIHLSVYRRSLLEEIGGFRPGFEGSQDYDLVLRFTEKTDKIFHIPKVLYHWKAVTGSVAVDVEAKPQTHERTRKALEEALARRGLEGSVEDEFYHSVFRAKLEITGSPKVSIIIPTEGDHASLERCLQSIETLTTYGNYEILIVDTGGTDLARLKYLNSLSYRVIPSAMNCSGAVNLAASRAEGGYLLFLNEGMEVISDGWMEAMLEHAQRPEIGAVGARLRYPDGRLYHAGIIRGAGSPTSPGVADYAHRFYPGAYPGYLGATLLPRNFSAVSGACMMLRKEVFEEAGGFDEKDLPDAYNDVDLCLRLGELGYRILYTPYAELRHHGTAIREPNPGESLYMRERWGEVLDSDPYYNPNFSLADGSYNLRADALRPGVLRAGRGEEADARSSRRNTLISRREKPT